MERLYSLTVSRITYLLYFEVLQILFETFIVSSKILILISFYEQNVCVLLHIRNFVPTDFAACGLGKRLC
jgi:hypothetical protein